MWLVLQHNKPNDYVIATGKSHTVREFVELAALEFGYSIDWDGKGKNEKGIDKNTGRTLILISPKYFRPTDVEYLLGDASKAKNKFGWKPKISFNELVKIMADSDKDLAQKESLILQNNV